MESLSNPQLDYFEMLGVQFGLPYLHSQRLEESLVAESGSVGGRQAAALHQPLQCLKRSLEIVSAKKGEADSRR